MVEDNLELDKSELLHARNDFRYFNEHVLGFKFPEFLYKALYGFIVSGKHYGAIEAPRGHGKTQFFTKNYVTWRIFREPGIKVAIASSSMDQTISFIDDIKVYFENNRYLKDLVPTDKITPWAREKLFFANGARLYAKPFGPGTRGTHVNLFVLDDILRDLEISILKGKNVFLDIMFPTVQTLGGDLLLVGTPMSNDDIFFDIENRIRDEPLFAKDWYFSKNPAVIVDEFDNWIDVLWPERYSIEKLRSIQNSMSPAKFSREYLLSPASFESSFFDKTYFVNSLSTAYALEHEPMKDALHFLGCDFAMSSKARADYSAFITVALKPGKVEVDYGDRKEVVENPIFVRNVFWGKGISYDNQILTIKRIYKDFNIVKAVVDKTNFGLKFYEDLKREYNIEGQDFPMARRNSLLTNLKVMFEKGRIILPFKDKNNTKVVIQELKNQLKGFTLEQDSASIKSKSKHDDLVIALALAVKNLDKKSFYLDSDSVIVSELDNKDDKEQKEKDFEEDDSNTVIFS